MNYQALKSHGRTFTVYYQVNKAANIRRLHVYDSNYMIFWKRQNYGDAEKISV